MAAEPDPLSRPLDEESASDFSAEWSSFADPGDVQTSRGPKLTYTLFKRDGQPVRATPSIRVFADGKIYPLRGVSQVAYPGEPILLEIRPAEFLEIAEKLQYSAKLDVELEVQPGDGAPAETVFLPPLYFHSEDRNLVLYREGALRKKFGAGNFRGARPRLENPVPAMVTALRDIGAPIVEPQLARVGIAGSLGGGQPAPAPVSDSRFCFFVDGDGYYNSSGRSGNGVVVDFGEDFGRADSVVPMRRGWVSVGQNLAPLYSGFLDGTGCTPYLMVDQQAPVTVAFFPIYLNLADNVRGFVSDLNLAPAAPEATPYFLFDVDPAGPLTFVMLDKTESAYLAFGAASQAMERFDSGLTDALFEFRLRQIGDNNGTFSFYADEGHPAVLIKNPAAAVSKFSIAHEYGHCVALETIRGLAPALMTSDLDYSVDPGEGEQHSMTSKEWQLAAALEGFGHFVAAVAWNEVGPNEDAVYVSGANAIPQNNTAYALNQFDQRFLTNFNPAQNPGQGVEMDWAQFFWNYHTDTPLVAGVAPPSQSNLLSMWKESYTWPKNEGFYTDFLGGVLAVLPATAPVPTPLASKQAWFTVLTTAAGIVP
jgi:hypothetical protein